MQSLKRDSQGHVNPFADFQPLNLTADEWAAIPKYTPDYSAPAKDLAEFAHKHNFSSRRGILEVLIDRRPLVVIYNNNPYADPTWSRDDETAIFREWLSGHGIEELAYETDPSGYTFAMILDGAGRMEKISAAYTDALRKYERGRRSS